MSDAAAATAAPSGIAEGMPTVAPEPVQRRFSEMGVGETVTLQPLDAPPPANKQQPQLRVAPEPEPEVGEGEVIADPLEAQPESQPETPEAESPEALAAEWKRHKDSPDLDLEAFGDKVIWTKDRDGNPVPMRVADVERHTMLYADYQFKTRETAERNRKLDARENGYNMFQKDLLSGDPQLAMKAMRWMGAEKSMHSMVVAYVQRMARLEGLAPDIREEFLAGERARDRAEALERQLQFRQQQEQALAEQQAQQQGMEAPDIVHVQKHVSERLPTLYKEFRAVSSPLFDGRNSDGSQADDSGGILGAVFKRAAEGVRDASGQWIEPPVIRRGTTPTDETLRRLVGEAWEQTQRLIASSGARQPPKPKLPPVAAAAVTGPAAKPGQRGNISQPESLRWSDMGKKRS